MRIPSFLAALLVAGPAFADIPPDPSSPDAHCTPAEQCPGGTYCPYEFNPGKPPAPGAIPLGQACRDEATKKGLELRCRNGGNYGGNQLYCAKGAGGTWKDPKAKGSGCATGPGPAGGEAALLMAAGLVVLASRRRAR